MSVKINVRSPYFVRVTDPSLASVVLRLYVWEGLPGATTTAKYTFQKEAIGSDTFVVFEFADYVRDFIETEYNDYSTNAVWVKWDYQIYDSLGVAVGTLVPSSAYIALDGYGYFEEGVQPELSRQLLQSNTSIYYLDGQDIVFPVFAEDNSTITINTDAPASMNWEDVTDFWEDYDGTWGDGTSVINWTDNNHTDQKIKYIKITGTEALGFNDYAVITSGVGGPTTTIYLNKVCEPRYSPVEVIFYNKFGAMQSLWFFKRSNTTLNIESETFKRNIMDFSSSPMYNTAKHQMKSFNVNGVESLSLNTGYLPESFNEVIKQLLLSEEIWASTGGQVLPVVVKTESLTYKTSVNDKLINYTIEFDYAFDKINNIR